MERYIVLGAFLGVINAICVATDASMAGRHKVRVHTALMRFWMWLDELKVRDFPLAVAHATLRLKDILLDEDLRSTRATVASVAFSCSLTTLALVFGFWRGHRTLGLGQILQSLFESLAAHLPVLYVSNLIFDWLTIAVSAWFLAVIVRRRATGLLGISLLSIDAIFAYCLAVGCIVTAAAGAEVVAAILPGSSLALNRENMFPPVGPQLLVRAAETVFDTTNAFLSLGTPGAQFTPFGVYAITTFLPTIIYTSMLSCLIMAKGVLVFGRHATLYTIDTATEVDPSRLDQARNFKPFTLLGILITVLTATLTFIVALEQYCVVPATTSG